MDSETSDNEGNDDSYVSATGDPPLPSLDIQNQLNIDPDLNLNPDMNQPTQTNEQLLATMALLSAQYDTINTKIGTMLQMITSNISSIDSIKRQQHELLSVASGHQVMIKQSPPPFAMESRNAVEEGEISFAIQVIYVLSGDGSHGRYVIGVRDDMQFLIRLNQDQILTTIYPGDILSVEHYDYTSWTYDELQETALYMQLKKEDRNILDVLVYESADEDRQKIVNIYLATRVSIRFRTNEALTRLHLKTPASSVSGSNLRRSEIVHLTPTRDSTVPSASLSKEAPADRRRLSTVASASRYELVTKPSDHATTKPLSVLEAILQNRVSKHPTKSPKEISTDSLEILIVALEKLSIQAQDLGVLRGSSRFTGFVERMIKESALVYNDGTAMTTSDLEELHMSYSEPASSAPSVLSATGGIVQVKVTADDKDTASLKFPESTLMLSPNKDAVLALLQYLERHARFNFNEKSVQVNQVVTNSWMDSMSSKNMGQGPRTDPLTGIPRFVTIDDILEGWKWSVKPTTSGQFIALLQEVLTALHLERTKIPSDKLQGTAYMSNFKVMHDSITQHFGNAQKAIDLLICYCPPAQVPPLYKAESFSIHNNRASSCLSIWQALLNSHSCSLYLTAVFHSIYSGQDRSQTQKLQNLKDPTHPDSNFATLSQNILSKMSEHLQLCEDSTSIERQYLGGNPTRAISFYEKLATPSNTPAPRQDPPPIRPSVPPLQAQQRHLYNAPPAQFNRIHGNTPSYYPPNQKLNYIPHAPQGLYSGAETGDHFDQVRQYLHQIEDVRPFDVSHPLHSMAYQDNSPQALFDHLPPASRDPTLMFLHQQVSALQQQVSQLSGPPKPPQICYVMNNTGKCAQGTKCPHSHDPAHLKAFNAAMADKWDQIIRSHGPPPSAPRQHFSAVQSDPNPIPNPPTDPEVDQGYVADQPSAHQDDQLYPYPNQHLFSDMDESIIFQNFNALDSDVQRSLLRKVDAHQVHNVATDFMYQRGFLSTENNGRHL